MTESTQTSAIVPIHTPPIGTVVKNVKPARSVPKNVARNVITPPIAAVTSATVPNHSGTPGPS